MSTGLLLSQVKRVYDVIDSVDADLVPRVTYLEAKANTYDFATRGYTASVVQHEGIPVVIAQPETDAAQDVAHATAKFVIAAENMPDGVLPKVQDRIQTADYCLFNIVGIKSVPGNSVYLIYAEESDS